ncbi:hypothetical protein MAMC_00990 [Methylacidimicrobium cyclopophantes]|uniref:DUF4276 family protein n=1 Tax=Methylacidimicrobium cyclopophantes TaxID=1041766 RepID=A0A5E6MD05_9BACT|nr:DUF4276 family protein [Methylacidimicrobium cyclopophantes]VVM06206.1 hypothetical protein MAMC_00990 [Methylacidimicrobium cyclopophantes]
MPDIGLLVDGEYDKAALGVLDRRLSDGPRVRVRTVSRGSLHKAIRILRVEQQNVNSFLWITDAEQEDPNRRRREMERRVEEASLGIPVECVVAVPMLEAWLLADPNALRSVVGISKREARIEQPERLPGPKDRLERLFSQTNQNYTPEAARRIATELCIEAVSAQCPSFRQLQKAVGQIAR